MAVPNFVPSAVDVAVIVTCPTETPVTTPAVTVAIPASLVDQVTPCGALFGNTAAVNVVVPPTRIASVAGLTVTLDTATSTTSTVIVVETVGFATEVTVIVHVPIATELITPPDTVATDELLDAHVTDLLVAFVGSTVAVTVVLSPNVKVTSVWSTVIPVTGVAITLIVAVPTTVPSATLVAVIVTGLPIATPVTRPEVETLATAALLDVHVTVLLFVSAGKTVSDNCTVSATSISCIAGLIAILVGKTSNGAFSAFINLILSNCKEPVPDSVPAISIVNCVICERLIEPNSESDNFTVT
ncbi:MAG: hypothetical protein BWY22_00187 [Bacteroidetes bacterium ADurb.Bin217]|nr:MAG: hypothetical protein BWY22_00187 [Bacteroidetes bacterium ADurb.Bin217]